MFTILHEDEDILVIDKPPGLPAQPGEAVSSSVVSVVERELGFRPFLVHRLDKDTCGCMLLAKSSAAAARYSALLKDEAAGKTYWAVCRGSPTKESGVYSDPLGRSGDESALSEYRLIARFGGNEAEPAGFSLLELRLKTGRMHQIRKHCSMHGHPLLGDDKYGDFPLNRRLKRENGLNRLLLWARRLDIPGHLSVESSPPAHFRDFLAQFPDAPNPEDS